MTRTDYQDFDEAMRLAWMVPGGNGLVAGRVPAGRRAMRERRWYEADALMADLTVSRCVILDTSQEEVERKMRERHPGAVAVLARRETARAEARRRLSRRNA